MTAEPSTLRAAEDHEHDLPKMSFLDHLDELRKRLIYSTIAVIVAFFVCWNWADGIFAKLQEPLSKFLPRGDKLAYTQLTAPFFLYMKVAFFAGLFLAAPFLLLQVWLFISPGLYKRERRMAVPFIFFATAFFLIGGYLGWRFLLPVTCGFFVQTGKEFKAVITVDDYFSFASKIIMAAGLIFETPILIFFLARFGIVTPAFLMQKFKYAVVLSFIVAAIITPSPDVVTQTAFAVPMLLLYLIGVAIAHFFGKKKEA
jgi:sec-independent protein translocase protein TatC